VPGVERWAYILLSHLLLARAPFLYEFSKKKNLLHNLQNENLRSAYSIRIFKTQVPLTSVSIRLLGLDILSLLSRGLARLCARAVGLGFVLGVQRIFCLSSKAARCETIKVVERERYEGGGGCRGY
jgi:hypothetical protein